MIWCEVGARLQSKLSPQNNYGDEAATCVSVGDDLQSSVPRDATNCAFASKNCATPPSFSPGCLRPKKPSRGRRILNPPLSGCRAILEILTILPLIRA